MKMAYELIDVTTDPLYILMMREEDEDECDSMEERYMAGTHRARSSEAERTHGDMLGASPFELNAASMVLVPD
jgi:hypothetical protein